LISLAALIGYSAQGIGYGFAAAAQPGAFQTFVISQTLANGWRRTLPAALAPLISDGPIIVLMLFVLTRLPEWARGLLHLASGVFILYLARGAVLAWRHFDAEAIGPAAAGQLSLFKGAVMNLASPGPYIYWGLVAGPILVQAWSQSATSGLAFLAGFYCAMVATLAGIILLFGTARQLGPSVNRTLLIVSAIIMAGVGVYQLWLGASLWWRHG
jgi:threonine/homoserine/homoserine lactone efflux protein